MPVEFTERFGRQYERLSGVLQRKVDKALRLLEADFRHPGLRSHPVESFPGIFEARVDDKYRMTFERQARRSSCATWITTTSVSGNPGPTDQLPYHRTDNALTGTGSGGTVFFPAPAG